MLRLERAPGCVVLAAVLLVLSVPTAARGHGVIEESVPGDGARVRLPSEVAITLTERPTSEAFMRVVDGCRRDVAEAVTLRGRTIAAGVGPAAQPGRWTARFRVISAVDGHPTRGGIEFSVRGRRDCSPEATLTAIPTQEPPDESPPPVGSDSGDEDGSSLPVIPVAVGSALLVGLALLVRRAGGT